jgi:enoyl-CoA hydratase/carnithine racemase
MWQELRQIGRNLPGDVRVVVVRGEGRAFSAGLDLRAASPAGTAADTTGLHPRPTGADTVPVDLRPAPPGADSDHIDSRPAGSRADSRSADPRPEPPGEDLSFSALALLPDGDALDRIARFQEAFSWLRSPDLVSIAAVQGHAIGAGFQLALACDLRVLTEDAQLTMAEISLGLVPDLGGTRRLVELVGYGRAMDICLTARRVGATEALQYGLATAVVPAADLDQRVGDLIALLLAPPRSAVVEIKALLATALGRSVAAQEAAEREAQLRRLRDLVGLGE